MGGKIQDQRIQLTKIKFLKKFQRSYLICPDCGKRRKQLYLNSNCQFSCRICSNLGYKSQRLTPHLRHGYLAEKIRCKNLKQSLKQPFVPSRPKHMSLKKYHKLVDRIFWHEKRSTELFIQYFKEVSSNANRKTFSQNFNRIKRNQHDVIKSWNNQNYIRRKNQHEWTELHH